MKNLVKNMIYISPKKLENLSIGTIDEDLTYKSIDKVIINLLHFTNDIKRYDKENNNIIAYIYGFSEEGKYQYKPILKGSILINIIDLENKKFEWKWKEKILTESEGDRMAKLIEMTVTGLDGVSSLNINNKKNIYINNSLEGILDGNIGDMGDLRNRLLHRIRKDNEKINESIEMIQEMLDDDNITPSTLFNTDFGKSNFVLDGASDSRGYLIDNNTIKKDPIDEIIEREKDNLNISHEKYDMLNSELYKNNKIIKKNTSNQSIDKILLLTKELVDSNVNK